VVIHKYQRRRLKGIICKGRRHIVCSGGLKARVCCIEGEGGYSGIQEIPDRDEDHMVSKIA
jgi:hypothetical protein